MLRQPPAHWYSPEVDQAARQAPRLGRCLGLIDGLSTGVAALAALLCIVLAFLTTVLVIFGAFNMVHNGFEELKWHLCGALFMLSGAYCLERNAHVRVDTLYAGRSPLTKAVIDALGIIVLLWPLLIAVVCYGFENTADAFSHGEASNDAGGLPYRWIIKSTIPLGFLLLFLQSVAVLLRALYCISKRGRVADA